MNALEAVKNQATRNVFANLIDIALTTGNIAGARSRVQEAREVLPPVEVALLVIEANEDHGVFL